MNIKYQIITARISNISWYPHYEGVTSQHKRIRFSPHGVTCKILKNIIVNIIFAHKSYCVTKPKRLNMPPLSVGLQLVTPESIPRNHKFEYNFEYSNYEQSDTIFFFCFFYYSSSFICFSFFIHLLYSFFSFFLFLFILISQNN